MFQICQKESLGLVEVRETFDIFIRLFDKMKIEKMNKQKAQFGKRQKFAVQNVDKTKIIFHKFLKIPIEFC